MRAVQSRPFDTTGALVVVSIVVVMIVSVYILYCVSFVIQIYVGGCEAKVCKRVFVTGRLRQFGGFILS
jgi:hypothetical protein